MHSDLLVDFGKPIGALLCAGATLLADTAALPGLPEWVSSLGLPVAFLIAVMYALASIHTAYKQSMDDRIKDRDEHESRMDKLVANIQESRERLIRATEQQTSEFRALADEIRRKG
jgi:hypothetical protein